MTVVRDAYTIYEDMEDALALIRTRAALGLSSVLTVDMEECTYVVIHIEKLEAKAVPA